MLHGKSEPLHPHQGSNLTVDGYLHAFAKLEAADPEALSAFATEVGRFPNDRLASFHLKRLLNSATGARIRLD